MFERILLMYQTVRKKYKAIKKFATEAVDVLNVTVEAMEDDRISDEEKALIIAEAKEAIEAWKAIRD